MIKKNVKILKNSIVVITGAGRGLGKSLVAAFTNREAHVIASDIDSRQYKTDVRDEVEVKRLADEIVKKFGQIDIWINNAGIWLPRMSVQELDMNRVREIFNVNVFGTIHGTRAALKIMEHQGKGTIVNIVSTAALVGRPFFATYSASKHAEKGFTDSVREELREQGSNVSIIGIYPGGIKTNLFDEKKPDDFAKYMEPEFVAEAIVANLEKEKPEPDLILKRPGQDIKFK